MGHAMTDLRSVRTLARVAASGRANRQAIVAAGGLEVFVALVALSYARTRKAVATTA